MINQDILEKQAKIAYLSIGSNLGNRYYNIEKTKFELSKKKIFIINSSKYYESLSWPDPRKPKFYNIVLKVKTRFTKKKLLLICKNIEKSLGRKKTPINSPRVCDIDIIDYNKELTKNGIILPHPRMHNRNFVLIPLFEVDRDWKHPITKQHIKTLIFSLPKKMISSIKQI